MLMNIKLCILFFVCQQRLKRFCCSACPYRSNFRSDVVRHIRHKHPEIGSAQIFVMNPEDAAATLADYLNTWAKKKFVLVSSSRQNEKRRKGLKVSSTKCATKQSTNSSRQFNCSSMLNGIQGTLSPYPLNTFEIDSIEESNMTKSCVLSDLSELSSLKHGLLSNVDQPAVENITANVRQDRCYRDIDTTTGRVVLGGGSSRYRCHHCPYVSRNRNDYLHHRLFHRQRPSAARFKCEKCDYWAAERRLLSKHYIKVHHIVSTVTSLITRTTSTDLCDVIKGDAESKVCNELGSLPSTSPSMDSATKHWPTRTALSAAVDGDPSDDLRRDGRGKATVSPSKSRVDPR